MFKFAFLPLALLQSVLLVFAIAPTTTAANTPPDPLKNTTENGAGPSERLKDLQTIGEARDQKGGGLLYREYYYCSESGEHCSVVYRDTNNTVISRKALDYSASLIAPSVAIEDLRQNEAFTLARKPESNAVVDAGFDNYVRSQWDALNGGEQVKFEFLVVGAKKPYKMRAQRDSDAKCAEEQLCLTVEIDSWLLGLVAPTIELVYSREDRTLLRFVGTSNIRSVDNKTQSVDIAYRYENLRQPQ
ncbi:MAG: hypothetical protein AB8C02_09375 [Halioglobus sp.]